MIIVPDLTTICIVLFFSTSVIYSNGVLQSVAAKSLQVLSTQVISSTDARWGHFESMLVTLASSQTPSVELAQARFICYDRFHFENSNFLTIFPAVS